MVKTAVLTLAVFAAHALAGSFYLGEGKIGIDTTVDPEYSAAVMTAYSHLSRSIKRDQEGNSCTGQNDDCCTADSPCGLGEGDCDSDDQCYGDMVCLIENDKCSRTVVIPATSDWGVDTRTYVFRADKDFSATDHCCALNPATKSILLAGNDEMVQKNMKIV